MTIVATGLEQSLYANLCSHNITSSWFASAWYQPCLTTSNVACRLRHQANRSPCVCNECVQVCTT
ncbi:hypothetical protein HMPREF3192_00125 [Atopobium deltae]|uniref:Uncharacterized protein n=1 Tax=Atopobium deltae TaxID=1393034 RepID=A0A133XX00_9ACTN|nr:hypothetical protein HMPREF3192_00125 [Atopobium deltae]